MMDFFFKEITHSLQLKHLEYVELLLSIVVTVDGSEIWEADVDMATKILSSRRTLLGKEEPFNWRQTWETWGRGNFF